MGGCEERSVAQGGKRPGREGRKEDTVAVELSCTEKEVLKLSKKIREIMKLEESQVGGATLQSNQQDKVNGKEHIVAQFLDLLEFLPAASDVMAKVRHLTPAIQQVKAHVGDQSAAGRRRWRQRGGRSGFER